MKNQRVYSYSVASVYKFYIPKAEKGGYGKVEVDEVMRWLMGYSQAELDERIQNEVTFKDFFEQAPQPNPNRNLITGVICGIRVEEIKEPLMQEIRYLDKLIDELAKGKAMDKILRKP